MLFVLLLQNRKNNHEIGVFFKRFTFSSQRKIILEHFLCSFFFPKWICRWHTGKKKTNSVFCRQLFDSFERVKYQEQNHEIDFEGLVVATRILFFCRVEFQDSFECCTPGNSWQKRAKFAYSIHVVGQEIQHTDTMCQIKLEPLQNHWSTINTSDPRISCCTLVAIKLQIFLSHCSRNPTFFFLVSRGPVGHDMSPGDEKPTKNKRWKRMEKGWKGYLSQPRIIISTRMGSIMLYTKVAPSKKNSDKISVGAVRPVIFREHGPGKKIIEHWFGAGSKRIGPESTIRKTIMKLSVGQRCDFWLQTVGPQENNQKKIMKRPRTQRINQIFSRTWSHRISTDGDP